MTVFVLEGKQSAALEISLKLRDFSRLTLLILHYNEI